MKNDLYLTEEGFPFVFDPSACSRCGGRCCNGESGHIWVNRREMDAMANYLGISVEVFAQKYLKKVGYRFSIMEREKDGNFACLFYDEEKKGCGLYEVRPAQCRTFPFWDYFKTRPDEAAEECPGIIFDSSVKR
ncbi:MAG: YkgJ family cysteine cluster protein [Desulfobacterales bacterium]|nr:YkgJ family cysteine cluster protein [Desulfobacterales bacterium]